MMTFNILCDTCTQAPKCKVKQDLYRVAATQPYNKLTNEVTVHCKLYKNCGKTFIYPSTCTSVDNIGGNPQPVQSCKNECAFFPNCSDICDSSTFGDFVIDMKDITPALSFANMCRCKISLEEKDG